MITSVGASVDLHLGDCLDVLATIPESSIETCITDPPYGLAFMGKAWDHGVPGVPFWEAVLRVLKPGAMLLAFGGTRTYHRLACAIEDAGFEIRDCVMWLYGQGFPKSLDISKAIDKAAGAERETWYVPRNGGPGGQTDRIRQIDPDRKSGVGKDSAPSTDLARQWDGYGTALKPAWEPILLAMKPLDGTFAANAERHGVAGLHIDGARVATDAALGRTNNARESGTSYVVQRERSTVDNSGDKGRFPANLVLDESAARALDEQSGELQSGELRDGPRANRNGFAGPMPEQRGSMSSSSGGASRFFYTAKASGADRGNRDAVELPLFGETVPAIENRHPTVKPTTVMEWLVELTRTPTGGTVLDPFMGSGTTGVACKRLGRAFVGIELDPESYDTARARIEST